MVSGSDAERVLAERSEAGVERRAVRLGAGACCEAGAAVHAGIDTFTGRSSVPMKL